MYLIAVAWIYVVVMLAVVEAASPTGTLLGAFFTLLLYGALPLSVVLYVMRAPARRRARRAVVSAGVDPDGGGHAAGDAVAAERKEP